SVDMWLWPPTVSIDLWSRILQQLPHEQLSTLQLGQRSSLRDPLRGILMVFHWRQMAFSGKRYWIYVPRDGCLRKDILGIGTSCTLFSPSQGEED
ncbi:hypothetical protein KI387_041730, partial [Taxus chinensis]